MPVFNDSEAKVFTLLPDGDYVWRCTEFEIGIMTGGKTNGSEKYSLKLGIEGKDCEIFETLIDHKSVAWKIDTFLKSGGVQLAKGESFEFRADLAQEKKVRWINPLGLRGWCRLYTDNYTKRDGSPGKSNKVEVFYTDKPKLAPARIEVEPTAQDDIPFS
jgi:hypothetical protein